MIQHAAFNAGRMTDSLRQSASIWSIYGMLACDATAVLIGSLIGALIGALGNCGKTDWRRTASANKLRKM